MKNPKLAAECAGAVVKAVNLPVTVKMRAGWDEDTVTCAEVAKRCEAAGVAAIAVHGRTRTQMYTPPIHPAYIAAVVRAVDIPVIGNGDITSAAGAKKLMDDTGCAMVMVGRGAMGNLWLFSEITAFLKGEAPPPPPTLRQRLDLLKRQVRAMCEEKGEERALREARTHAAFYLKGVRGAAKFRNQTSALTYYTDLEALCGRVLCENQNG
ncbi:MAG: tRNA-dihydrouridine synthase, partial [Oscillospiraceae bacterium]|nr:tRNA-dihydrouridine synthase [Oscillospiraceae bacterium]